MGQNLEDISYTPDEVSALTAAIRVGLLRDSKHVRSGNFGRIATADLSLLFERYDADFFDGLLGGLIERTGDATLRFRLSSRMTRSAGKTARDIVYVRNAGHVERRTIYEIAMASDMLFQAFGEDHRTVSVNGHVCHDRLEALQRVFEHELIHLAEMLVWGDSSCRRRRFRALAYRIFAHTETTHRLITRREKALAEHGIHVGQRVAFEFEGVRHTGLVNRITKRATVLVESPAGTRYDDGKRYKKFYVPVPWLKRIEP